MVVQNATMVTIEALRQQGITTAAGIAKALNEREITTPSGGQWYARQVQRAITSSTVRETGRDSRPPPGSSSGQHRS